MKQKQLHGDWGIPGYGEKLQRPRRLSPLLTVAKPYLIRSHLYGFVDLTLPSGLTFYLKCLGGQISTGLKRWMAVQYRAVSGVGGARTAIFFPVTLA
jgi:hypothetical protein